MSRKSLAATVSAALSVSFLATGAEAAPAVKSVEFLGMPAPATADEKTDMYTKAQMKVTYKNGKSRTLDLQYHELMATTETVGGKVVGGLYDAKDAPLADANGPLASDSPDGNSLMVVKGLKPTARKRNALALITQYEYKELPPAGQTGSFWGKLPMSMSLAKLNQDKKTGRLTAATYDNISFAALGGLWIPCASSLSPWNTHLGSEEYEPDAKVHGGGVKAKDSDDGTDLKSFSKYFFGDENTANPYHYGLVPEVTVKRNGAYEVTKHYALGRIARELAEVMPDQRTVYMGDDGAATGLFLFVADQPKNLSAGTLYAAKWTQTSDQNGGAADLTWVKLGSASDDEIRALVEGGITFADIFDARNEDPQDAGYQKVRSYTGTEWLKLKPGMEKAAAFLETRRYAAYLGATTEFTKMEGIAHDPRKDKAHGLNGKAFVVISRIETTMKADAAAPADDIRLPENFGGGIYELDLVGGVADTSGAAINSPYVAKNMRSIPELLGGWLGKDAAGKEIKDAEGNRCAQDQVCGGDNLKYSPATRTLFVGEDTGRRNNNYVWAFNLDTRTLSRILSTPMGAEATGLQVVENAYGFGYVMSNFQHPGEGSKSAYTGTDKQEVLDKLNQKWKNLSRASIGYVGTAQGGLPAFRK
jgi:secreted PhoX family phosphatase